MDVLKSSEKALGDQFLAKGHIIQPAEDRAALDRIRALTAAAAANFLKIPLPGDIGDFLNNIHKHVTVAQLNDMRLAIIDVVLSTESFRADYFACARSLVETIVGNELAMQRNVGLSTQLPNDDSSLLPLHSDTWGSECSPYEVVLWIPLVDCQGTKSMFLLPPAADRKLRTRVGTFERDGVEALFKAAEPDLVWTNIKYGEVLLFTPTVMHGNRVNRESTTRWSFNVRLKGLFTPYSNKKLGDYFAPIAVRPASRAALDFEMPAGADA
jgi:sporadic carbohydrate cluster 2OG-Fe(II) oxygenase